MYFCLRRISAGSLFQDTVFLTDGYIGGLIFLRELVSSVELFANKLRIVMKSKFLPSSFTKTSIKLFLVASPQGLTSEKYLLIPVGRSIRITCASCFFPCVFKYSNFTLMLQNFGLLLKTLYGLFSI